MQYTPQARNNRLERISKKIGLRPTFTTLNSIFDARFDNRTSDLMIYHMRDNLK